MYTIILVVWGMVSLTRYVREGPRTRYSLVTMLGRLPDAGGSEYRLPSCGVVRWATPYRESPPRGDSRMSAHVHGYAQQSQEKEIRVPEARLPRVASVTVRSKTI